MLVQDVLGGGGEGEAGVPIHFTRHKGKQKYLYCVNIFHVSYYCLLSSIQASPEINGA